MPDSFVHLHTHTEYSLLDGAARVSEVVAAAAADGQTALGITDHGNLYGVVDFYKTCRDQGVKPIIGTEAYMALESRDERPTRSGTKVDDLGGETFEGQKLFYHLTLLAANGAGYRNLLKLSSRAFLEGYYYKPRMDWEMFAEHSEGLIATTGCLGSVVQQALLKDDYDQALAHSQRLQDIFGRDNLYVELQDHGIAEQHRCNPRLVEIAAAIGAPLLATNDLHYTSREHAAAHDALLCVQTKSLIADDDRLSFGGDEHYLKSAAEMRALFDELPSACDNTLAVAERANVEIEFGRVRLPKFPVPPEHAGVDEYLKHLAFEGAHRRWGAQLREDVVERLAYELRVISDMGFSSYFLIVWDLIRHARSQGIRVGPGRGSAAGCAVAYSLGITDLDPIRYDLLFERFLNPERVSMPDIDIDFDDRRRDDMIRYAAAAYGHDHVAQIITFSTIKARNAIRDAARVMGYPFNVGARIAGKVPPLVMGRATPLWACLERNPEYTDGYAAAVELRALYDAGGDERQVIDVALGLEGLRRQDSVHAAAVVISPDPLTDVLPIQRKPDAGSDSEPSPIVTQFDMGAVEALGLLKMDFLGLRTLSIIDETVRLVERNSGVAPDIDNVDLDDDATFELLAAGDTLGVFQLESGPVRSLLRSLAPTSLEDVSALVALYRPGPMAAGMHNDYADCKNGRKQVDMPHPDLDEILGETYGLMIYQEEMMRVAQRIAGYTLAEADDLRKACGKKNRRQIAEHREKFVSGSVAAGYDEELGTQLFDLIEPFADYAFNKSHAFAYGLIAYQTAYLKANHRTEFMAALLTGNKNRLDRAGTYLNECRQVGITVQVPDINESEVDFSGAGDRIRFGLSAVRNVGAAAVPAIVAEREQGGPFADFTDFAMRVPEAALNRSYVSALTKAGAFDSLGHPRKGLLTVAPLIVKNSLRRRRDADVGVQSLFAGPASAGTAPTGTGPAGTGPAGTALADTGPAPAADGCVEIPPLEADERTTLAWEKEMLGLYVSSHPLRRGEKSLRARTDCAIADLLEPAPDAGDRTADRAGDRTGQPPVGGGDGYVTIGGIVSKLDRRSTRRGEMMAGFALEDLTGTIDVTVFPKTYAETADLLADDALVVVRGRLEQRSEDEEAKFLAARLERLDIAWSDRSVEVRVNPRNLDTACLTRFRQVLAEHPGKTAVRLRLGSETVQLGPDCHVDAETVAGALREMFGADAVRT
ncbi:MAG TPA: DNA polymerase III subunit alpha [Acidimicrobiaceae bacterium]|nr:DNA polymerase III subunit alpha [Acidimicrobiaceae bacterium]HCB37502.1 DNA polymerase III subunit alpha [Acidimicrobiaceae bacterium]